MRFSAVLFDLFGTLVPNFPETAFKASLHDMAEILCIDPVKFHRAWAFETWRDRATGAYATIEANLIAICSLLDTSASKDQLECATQCRIAFTRSVLRPRHDALALLSELRSRKISLGLVSDCSAEVPAIWPELPFAPLFQETASRAC